VVTQEMDEKSSTLGFMIAWISKMASKYDSVTVICLYKGVCFLPDNVKVISLGKEKSAAKPKLARKHYSYCVW
jgi:hypothetical protein